MAGKMPTWADAGFSTTGLIRAVSRQYNNDLSKSESPVLKVVIEDAGPDAVAVISAATLSERTGLSKPTVFRALRSLSKKGYIQSTRTGREQKYKLNIAKFASDQNDTDDHSRVIKSAPLSDQNVAASDHHDHTIESLRDSERVLEREDPAAFDEMIHQTITAFLNGELTDWRGRQAWIEMRRDSRRSAAKRYLRIRRGDCQQCGQELLEPGYLSGRLCLERERERQTQYRQSRRRVRYS